MRYLVLDQMHMCNLILDLPSICMIFERPTEISLLDRHWYMSPITTLTTEGKNNVIGLMSLSVCPFMGAITAKPFYI